MENSFWSTEEIEKQKELLEPNVVETQILETDFLNLICQHQVDMNRFIKDICFSDRLLLNYNGK